MPEPIPTADATATSTLRQLQRNVDRLRDHPALLDGVHVGRAPAVVDTNGRPLPEWERRLQDAIAAKNPARLHAWLRSYDPSDTITVDEAGQRAAFNHDGERHLIALHALTDYWVQTGHLIQ